MRSISARPSSEVNCEKRLEQKNRSSSTRSSQSLEVMPGFGIVFAFDVDAVKQALVVVDSLLDDGVCQKLKALF